MTKYFLFLFLLLGTTVFSQRPGGKPGGHRNRGNIKGSISGRIIDMQTKKGMEYVTIALFKNNDLVTGASSDNRGEFIIENLEMGGYIVKSSFIGYDTHIDSVKLTPKNPFIDLGNIKLSTVGGLLEEVEISADQPLVKYEIDKKVVDVSNMNTVASQSAVEVLENIPSINVDIDGNVSLRGSGSFTLLIDNKPSTLEISDALKMIPANSIQEIEIITNPSAKFDAEGVSGIINIILKKNRLDGVSALINANVGTYNNYGGDFLVNFNRKKLSITVGGNYRTGDRPRFITSSRETIIDTNLSEVNYNGESIRNWGGWGTNLELEWRPNRKSVLSIGGKYGARIMNSSSDLFFEEIYNGSLLNEYHNIESTERNFGNYSVNASYLYNVKGNKKHYINAKAMYNSFDGKELSVTEYFYEDILRGGNKNTEVGPSNMARFNLDYVRPLKNGRKLESGLQAQIGISQDATETFAYDTTAEDYVMTTLFNTNVNYFRNIYAAYAMYAGKWKKLGYQLGVREEYTDRIISSTNSSFANEIKRFDFFPSAHLSYQLDKKNQLMANVTKRIQRPRSWYFEPFITWQNAYSVRTGNSQLIPEYILSYETGWIRRLKKGNFSVELYHRDIKNKIERVRSVYQANIVLSKPENVGTELSTGMELSYSRPIAKWWKLDVSGNLYRYEVKGELEGQSFNQESFSYNARINNSFNLKNDWRMQLTGKYNSAIVTPQGTQSDNYSADFSLKKGFNENKIAASIQVRDVFSTSRTETFTESINLTAITLREPRTPTVVFSVSIKLNNYNRKQSRPDSSDEF